MQQGRKMDNREPRNGVASYESQECWNTCPIYSLSCLATPRRKFIIDIHHLYYLKTTTASSDIVSHATSNPYHQQATWRPNKRVFRNQSCTYKYMYFNTASVAYICSTDNSRPFPHLCALCSILSPCLGTTGGRLCYDFRGCLLLLLVTHVHRRNTIAQQCSSAVTILLLVTQAAQESCQSELRLSCVLPPSCCVQRGDVII